MPSPNCLIVYVLSYFHYLSTYLLLEWCLHFSHFPTRLEALGGQRPCLFCLWSVVLSRYLLSEWVNKWLWPLVILPAIVPFILLFFSETLLFKWASTSHWMNEVTLGISVTSTWACSHASKQSRVKQLSTNLSTAQHPELHWVLWGRPKKRQSQHQARSQGELSATIHC